jgi:hypothetical protein
MTRDEQRQAWRVYAAGMVSVLRWPINDMADVATWADALLKEERKRFDTPDHAGDANKMVEPRPWMGLTKGDIEGIVRYWQSEPPCAYAELVALVEGCLREKNGGTR